MHSRNPTEEELLWILLYADDISLVCDDITNLSRAVALMDNTFSQWGLTISTQKTKVLVVGRDAEQQAANAIISIRGDKLEVVSPFKYLGSIFTSDGTIDAEVAHRIAANIAFVRLHKAKVWSSRALSHFTKQQLFQSIVISVLLYGAETWTLLNKHCAALSVFLMSCLRHICGLSLKDHISYAAILSMCQTCSMHSQLRSKRLRWYGHVCRMLDSRLPKVMLFGQVKGSNPPGRPGKIWNDIGLSDFLQLNINRPYRDAQKKPAWRDRTWATHT